MPVITGIQSRKPYKHSSATCSHYDHNVNCAQFRIRSGSYGEGEVWVNVFFPRTDAPGQGVGLSFPSSKVAIAVARDLLTVAEGHLSEVEGHF